ncbi:MAG: OmpH family outer membrane protein [Flavobacteriales bacterium]|nr:OmpH family outer membrane protein [Flavobacteriales bacterium]
MTIRNSWLLVLWNVVLSALIAWALLGKPGAGKEDPVQATVVDQTVAELPSSIPRDTAALKDAHIAFFFMDSIQSQFDLVKESASRVESEGRRLEGNLMGEMKKAKARYAELMGKDHTYSTQAELAADEQELRGLEASIQQSQAEGQEQIDQLQMNMLRDITGKIQDYLAEYNSTHGFDFIFSIQDAGQIWVGNKGLDITMDVVNGLNAQHRAKKVIAPVVAK